MHKETLCESLVKHWCEETLKRWTIFKHFHYISFVHCATVAERKKHKCLASTAQCLKIRAKVSFWQISWFLVQEHELWPFFSEWLFVWKFWCDISSNFQPLCITGMRCTSRAFFADVLLFIPIVQYEKYGISSCKAANYEEERINKEKVNRSNSRYKRKALA